MDKLYRISVVTLVYNSENTLFRTMESVLSQSDLLFDDGSTDRTIAILREYEDKFCGKMRFYSEKDKDMYDAMNKGIAKAQGGLYRKHQ